MNILSLEHAPFEQPEYIGQWFNSKGHTVTPLKLYSRGASFPSLKDLNFLLIMGGPMNVDEQDKFPWLSEEKKFIKTAIDLGIPVLGICLGAQLIARALAAKVYKNQNKEIGWFPVRKTKEGKGSLILQNLPDEFTAFHWHGDTFDIPEGAIHLVESNGCKNQAFTYKNNVLALQFHPEVGQAGVKDFIKNNKSELQPAKYIQNAEDIINSNDNFERLRKTGKTILDNFQTVYNGAVAQANKLI
jgi:GMP synthase-like glutamine amidotransferase